MQISERIKYDRKTKEWFRNHPMAVTTVTQCESCGLYYKPILGHKCTSERNKTNDKI